ncbi:aldose 1-epimerase family protein [Aurantimonas sp. Leaf443]|uniref:aldose 1-epimerase family protein n=1 Tax=Aurantimonas sp. Leaf443 TaxID=1736378 RepID=UPI0006F83C46|nr:aldose 1-epimerase family protein [Aurantimonas sp. Leaf443]KQT85384.1 aldose epimerase [Aurantimonas sp. Leaf443]
MDGSYRIASQGIGAQVASRGAELTSLTDASGAELLWQAGPQWPRHAPVLFPTVGALAGDRLRHAGAVHTLPKHGFARDAAFSLVEADETSVTLRLVDDEATRAQYPFAFVLDLVYAVREGTLSCTTRVTNPGEGPLPCGVGAHPAFAWPLVSGVARTDHRITFEKPETGQVLAVVEGGLLGEGKAPPFEERELPLDPALFARDAIVMPDVASRSVRYAALSPEGAVIREIEVSWEGFKDLGIWSKPGEAPFVCIEPWYGMASPQGWDGDFMDKPGILVLAPGETRAFVWRVRL